MGISLNSLSTTSKIKLAFAALLALTALAGFPQLAGEFVQGMVSDAFIPLAIYGIVFLGLMPLYREASNPSLKKNYPWLFSALAAFRPFFQSAFYFVFSYFAFWVLLLAIVIAAKSLGMDYLISGSVYFWLALYIVVETFSGLGNWMERAFQLRA